MLDLGSGALIRITPVLVSEMASADHRGGLLGSVFIASHKLAPLCSFS